jgi:hypothetical protein
MPYKSQREIQIMERWIEAALKAGADSPRRVMEWIAQNADSESPSIPTITKYMREKGYEPAGYKWERKGR